jgi:catechol 2,3-dioxygenase
MSTSPAPARGISHLVLNVRDIEASHAFWTEKMGWELCGELHQPNGLGAEMRFYRGNPDHHHDLAIVQVPNPESLPPTPPWSMVPGVVGVNHIAIEYEREAWLRQLEHLQASGVRFALRGNHGMTHSVYIVDPDGYGFELLYDVPREAWQDDLDAALNHFEFLPNEGTAALEDSTEYTTFGRH